MLDPTLTARFSRNYGLAALDYAAAANQAYFEASQQMMSAWSGALGLGRAAPEPRSWYRHPDEPARSPAIDFGCGVPGFIAKAQVDAWQAMLTAPWTLTPTAWPAAYMMMASGWPQSVAWPAARATAAAQDAARAATEAIGQAYSSHHRTDGGHATAQLVFLPLKAGLAAVAAFPLAMGLPGTLWQVVLTPQRLG